MLKNKTVLITGTNRGIGRAILEEFAKEGANIIAHARKETTEFLEQIENAKKEYNVEITPVYFELTDAIQIKSSLKPFIIGKSPIDILVNCAGVAHVGMFSQTPVAKIKEIFDINYFAQLEIIQLIMKKMTRQGYGNVVNVGSVTGLITSEGQIPYSTSKLSLMQATKNLAAEYGRFNVRFNSVALGVVNTDMKESLNEDEIKYFEDRIIMKRFCEPTEAAKVIRFLASEDSSYINGQIIRVDGGML